MGHGNHWGAINGNLESCVANFPPRIVRDGKLIGSNDFDHIEDGVRSQGKVYGLLLGGPPLMFLGLVVDGVGEATDSKEFWSGYPVCFEGKTNRLTIEEIRIDENGIEGWVEASTIDGRTVIFFDPYLFLNKDRYRIKESHNIVLSGLAMQFRKAEVDSFTVDKGPMIEIERQRVLEKNPGADVSQIKTVEISLKGSTLYIPFPKEPGEGEFRATVLAVNFFICEGYEFCRVHMNLHPEDEGPAVTYEMYVSGHVLNGYRPSVGDDVEGFVWLQGRLAEE